MNRNRKGVMPEITRAMYKDIKKYDRQQFTDGADLYGYGFEDGKAAVPGVDIKEVYAALDQVKGIGPKVMERIHAALDPIFQEKKK